MPVSIAQSFQEKLPELRSTFTQSYRQISSSSPSTKNEDAVPAFFYERAAGLTELARQAIAAPVPASFNPVTEHMPIVERTHRLKSEADVLRAAILYLLHPVNVMLSAHLPQGYGLRCESEVSATHSRFDVQWTLVHANKEVKLAILEMKNTKVIHQADFMPAAVTPANAAKELEDAAGSEGGTLLGGNAFWLSKQAKKYSHTCKDVAVFDWNSMFIFDFNGVREDHREPRLVRGTYFDESDAMRQRENGTTFRLLLLGFLVRAYRRHH